MGILKTYSIVDDINSQKVKVGNLDFEIKAADCIIDFKGISREVDVLHIYGESIRNEADLDLLIYNHLATTLTDYKKEKLLSVDKKTSKLISSGFTYLGKTFSMSQLAQINLTNLLLSKTMLSYPQAWNTIDDLDVYDIVDEADAVNFYGAALNHKLTQLTSGTALKNSVRAATTETEVDDVEDQR